MKQEYTRSADEAYFSGEMGGRESAELGAARAEMTLDMIHVGQKQQKEFIRKALHGIDADKEPEKFNAALKKAGLALASGAALTVTAAHQAGTGKNTDNKMSRRNVLKISGLALGAMLLPGCRKGETIEPLKPEEMSNVKIAEDVIYYGNIDAGDANQMTGAAREKFINTMQSYKGVAIVDAGFVKPTTLNNAMPYVSLTGINVDAVNNPYNLDEDFKKLYRDIDAIGGWLKRPDTKGGGIQKWLSPSIFMVDLRRKDVYDLMLGYMKKKVDQFPAGIKIDDIDSAAYLEVVTQKPEYITDKNNQFYQENADSKYRAHNNGYTDAALNLITDIGRYTNAQQPDPKTGRRKVLVANGGFNQHPDGSNKVFETLAKIPNIQMEKESFIHRPIYENGQVAKVAPYSTGDRQWLDGRLYGYDENGVVIRLNANGDIDPNGKVRMQNMVQAFNENGVRTFKFIGYDPATKNIGSRPEDLYCNVAEQYEKRGKLINSLNVGVNFTVYNGERGINDKDFPAMNAELREKGLCR